MKKQMPLRSDTICAVATPPGRGAIGIVRVSGKEAFRIVGSVFRAKLPFDKLLERTVYLGGLYDGKKFVDEVLLVKYVAPASYTGEDMVEIFAHGGTRILSWITDLLQRRGASPALPGEFTFRAVSNGKMTIEKAESINEMITSRTRRGLELAQRKFTGSFKRFTLPLESNLKEALVNIEASIDFPEQGIEPADVSRIQQTIASAISSIDEMLEKSERCNLLLDGAEVILCGAPNVGKSSIFNILVRDERVIVSDEPGTTRDLVEATLNIAGVPVRLYDSAGIRTSGNSIELEGVRRTWHKIERVDLILLVVDVSKLISDVEKKVIGELSDREPFFLLNKADLGVNEETVSAFPEDRRFVISAKTKDGMDRFEAAFERFFDEHLPEDGVFLSASLSGILRKAKRSLALAKQNISQEAYDLAASDIREALDTLSFLTGKNLPPEEILDSIFSRFCIGK